MRSALLTDGGVLRAEEPEVGVAGDGAAAARQLDDAAIERLLKGLRAHASRQTTVRAAQQ